MALVLRGRQGLVLGLNLGALLLGHGAELVPLSDELGELAVG